MTSIPTVPQKTPGFRLRLLDLKRRIEARLRSFFSRTSATKPKKGKKRSTNVKPRSKRPYVLGFILAFLATAWFFQTLSGDVAHLFTSLPFFKIGIGSVILLIVAGIFFAIYKLAQAMTRDKDPLSVEEAWKKFMTVGKPLAKLAVVGVVIYSIFGVGKVVANTLETNAAQEVAEKRAVVQALAAEHEAHCKQDPLDGSCWPDVVKLKEYGHVGHKASFPVPTCFNYQAWPDDTTKVGYEEVRDRSDPSAMFLKFWPKSKTDTVLFVVLLHRSKTGTCARS